MEYSEARDTLESADWFPAEDAEKWQKVTGHIEAELHVLQELAAKGGMPEQAAAVWYAYVQRLRWQADYYERALIRYLRFEANGGHDKSGYHWSEIADLVQANLGSRQAAHAKWKRLVDGDRREAGSPGRGGWPKGRARRAVDDAQ